MPAKNSKATVTTKATPASVKTKAEQKKKIEESESEDDEVEINDSDNETDSSSESEEDTKTKAKKPKVKLSFEEITNKIEEHQEHTKALTKEIAELEKEVSSLQKEKNKYERLITSLMKELHKSHTDEVSHASKTKPKSGRKGNVNGGFNKEVPVPEPLRKYLGLEQGAAMARPKVMSALNNKLKEDGCKEGQVTTLSKSVVTALGLPKKDIGREIKFGEFQKWLASFYATPVDEEDNEE